MQTNGQRRPDQNKPPKWCFLSLARSRHFSTKKLVKILEILFFFWVSVNSTNFGNFIVKIRKRIDTGKKRDKRKEKKRKKLVLLLR
jgi:hypothetical protein